MEGSSLGVYKINQDATIDKAKKLIGVGVIVRDGEGKVLTALHSSQMYLTNPTIAKNYATSKVVQFRKDLSLQKILLEGDALTLLQAFQDINHSCQSFMTKVW